MKIITDLSTTSAPHRARYGSHPGWLFRNGGPGAWFDPSDPATLFQDAALTVPVTAPGQPVGGMLDKSGNGNHAIQTISAARPVYRTDGARHWLEFDGVDDRMQMQSSLNLNSGTIFLALTEPVGSGVKILISGGGSGYIGITGSGQTRTLLKNQGGQLRLVDTPDNFPMTAQSAVGLQVDGGTIYARRAGDPTEYFNAIPAATGLNQAQHLMAFSAAGELPVRADFFGAILLPDTVAGAVLNRALAYMNTRIAA